MRRIRKQYAETVFLEENAFASWVYDKYDNLLILRTCSKAIGMAAVRFGFAVANKTITTALRAAKSPYNSDTVAQTIVSEILTEKEAGEKNRRDLYDEDNELIDSVAEEIFNEAFGRLLENAESYYKEEILSVKARNVRGHWLTVPDSTLIKAISGGTAQ